MTFDATVNPVAYEGGEAVFIDTEYDTWNMDPVALEKAFAIYPEVKLVVMVHLYGTPARMDEIKDDLAGYGIEFNYKFRDFHDRCIKTDTGWTIQLGRGLDIYEKYNTYSIASSRQDKRKCKEFMVTYMKTKNA
jgi:hypothetical protein